MRSVQGSRVCARLRWLAAAFLLLACVSPAHAQVPAGYSEYYIPGDEDNLSLALCTHGSTSNACTSTNTHAVISVTGWADTTAVYYDHWENGYNFDPANPTTADETYTFNTGQRHGLRERHHHPPTNRDAPRRLDLHQAPQRRRGHDHSQPDLLCYDGRDRIYMAGGPVTVAACGVEPGERRGRPGVAWEIYPVKPQLTTYIFPFGENI